MNNQDYGFSEVDSDFHINVPKGNTVPAAFQCEDEMGISFVPNAYRMDNENYYEGMARGQDGSHLVQDAQSMQVPRKPGLDCPVFNTGGNEDSAGYTGNSGQTQVPCSQQYCSQYSNENVDNASTLPFSNCLQPPSETQYLNNVTQSQQCLDQFQHQDFQSQSDMFANRVPPLNHKVSPNTDIFPPSSTEFMECNSNPQILYPLASGQPIGTNSTAHSGSNEPTLIPGSFTESPLHCVNEYPQSEIPSLSGIRDVVSATSELHQTSDQNRINEGSVPNNGEVNQYSDVSTDINGTVCCDQTSVSNLTSVNESLLTTPQEVSDSYLGLDNPELKSSQNNEFNLQPPSEGCGLTSGGQSKDFSERLTLNHMSNADEVSVESAHTSSTSEKEDVIDLLISQETEQNDEFTTESIPEVTALEDKGQTEAGKNVEFLIETMSEVTAFKGNGQTEEEKSSVPRKECFSTKEFSACDETLDDFTDRLEEGIVSTSESITMEDRADNCQGGSSAKGQPLSPMITVMDSTFGEGEETNISMNTADSGEVVETMEHQKDHDKDNVRVTRSGTGSLRNRTQRFIEEYGDSDDSCHESNNADDWEYEEGAELAPCKVDSSITVSENVLTVTPEEEEYYKKRFPNGVNSVLKMRLHCTTCNRHIGSAPNYIHLGNRHKVLRVLTCNRCRSFYGVGKFPKDSDGSELFCRWCGQGGQVICCSTCPNVFCEPCIKRNFGPAQLDIISNLDDWVCFLCNYKDLWELRSICWAVLTYTMQKKKDAISTNDAKKMLELEEDTSKCCNTKNHKKRKSQVKSKVSSSITNTSQRTPVPQGETSFNSFEFGHFLFQNESFPEAKEIQGNIAAAAAIADLSSTEEDDFIDPSQFVQPVLEEKQSPKSTGRILQRRPPQTIRALIAPVPQAQPLPVRPRAPQQTVFRVSQQPVLRAPQQPVHRATQPAAFRATSPRIIIRQGNLMRPGLVPINNQPNSISSPIARAPVSYSASSGSHNLRNPPPFLNNIEGVRSLDQMQSLDQVPWFRDGIDSIRATGFALNKRIRELEARFHSLKNKQDVEKVMTLGKKLQRLTTKTMIRYKQMNLNLNDACKRWYIRRLGVDSAKAQKLDPLNLYPDCPSDWDDDKELSKPLEKVMIPVSSASLQGGVVRSSVRPTVSVSHPPPLVRTSTPVSVLRPQVTMQAIRPRPISVMNVRRVPPAKTSLPSDVTVTYTRQQLPGPKSGAIRYRQIPSSQPNAQMLKRGNPLGVGTFLNKRNGLNSVSVTLAPSAKRKRVESISSDSSDVVVCPTIPDLLEMYNIKPCEVMLHRNDDFIVSFLEKQQQERCLKSCIPTLQEMKNTVDMALGMETLFMSCDVPSEANSSVVESVVPNEDVLEGHSEMEESVIPGAVTVGALYTVTEEEEDDIEIIDEVNALDTSSGDNNKT